MGNAPFLSRNEVERAGGAVWLVWFPCVWVSESLVLLTLVSVLPILKAGLMLPPCQKLLAFLPLFSAYLGFCFFVFCEIWPDAAVTPPVQKHAHETD